MPPGWLFFSILLTVPIGLLGPMQTRAAFLLSAFLSMLFSRYVMRRLSRIGGHPAFSCFRWNCVSKGHNF
jgi:hypothetical protein